MIEGAAIALVCLAIGYLTGRRNRPMTIAEPKPATCGCGHVKSMHVDGKGRCTEIDTESHWEEAPDGRDVLKRVEYPCACQLYDGPEPLPAYYAPEIQP